MTIVGGMDVHRAQITVEYGDTATGEVVRDRVGGTRLELREWLSRFAGRDDVRFGFEGCTGWRYVAEELQRAGCGAYMAEPAETALLRGPKKRAKTDRADARHLRVLLMEGRLPLSWIPPGHVIEVRTMGRLYQDLSSTRRKMIQRVHAQLFHQGAPAVSSLVSEPGRERLKEVQVELSPAGRRLVDEAMGVVDDVSGRLDGLRGDLKVIGRTHVGPRALTALWGVGSLLAPIIWSEMGDTRRFSQSRQAVRHTGLDVTVHQSDQRRSPGRLSRQGSPTLRWALVEAAHHAAKTGSPDHRYYREVRDRVGASRAALSVARKLTRRVHHILKDLGDEAWELP